MLSSVILKRIFIELWWMPTPQANVTFYGRKHCVSLPSLLKLLYYYYYYEWYESFVRKCVIKRSTHSHISCSIEHSARIRFMCCAHWSDMTSQALYDDALVLSSKSSYAISNSNIRLLTKYECWTINRLISARFWTFQQKSHGNHANCVVSYILVLRNMSIVCFQMARQSFVKNSYHFIVQDLQKQLTLMSFYSWPNSSSAVTGERPELNNLVELGHLYSLIIIIISSLYVYLCNVL